MTTDRFDEDNLDEIHSQALARANEAWLFESDNVTEGREDQRFYAGDQWDSAARATRGVERPMLTVNRLPTFVRQLTGDVRQNTPAIKVMPAKGEASQEIADILNGLIRNVEAQSDGDACYVIAGENAAIAGQGAFRIVTEYSDDDGFDQDIRIRPIRDPFGVLIDPMAQLPDKSDMEYAFVFERLSLESFRIKYPDSTVDDMPNNEGGGLGFTWATGESVRIAEYWCKHATTKTLYLLEDGTAVDDVPVGARVVRERDVETHKVVSYLISGKEVLSGPHEWAGRYIPICFVVGEEITIDGATKRKGMVRDAKDPQRLYNYARTSAAEAIALQPKAPFILTVNQVRGHEDTWQTAGSKNHPYMVYNPDPMAPGEPKRSQPALGQQGLDSQAMLSAEDMKGVTGIYDASLGAKSNETSGRAILARQKEGDTGTFLYQDNLRRAISYAGRILVDLIPKVYDSERVIRILKEDGSHEMATINKQVPDAVNPGQFQTINDLSLGEYDVVVSTGPSFLTRRMEMADSLVNLAQHLPLVGQVAPDLVVKALDFPGGDEIAKRLEKALPPGMLEDKPAEPPPPDPLMVAKALVEGAKADKTKAETEGLEIDNATKLMQLQSGMAMMQNGMQGMQQMLQQILALNEKSGGGGAQPPPGGPPPMDEPQLEPMPDMQELEPMPDGMLPIEQPMERTV